MGPLNALHNDTLGVSIGIAFWPFNGSATINILMKKIIFKAVSALGLVKLYHRVLFVTVDDTQRRVDSTDITVDRTTL